MKKTIEDLKEVYAAYMKVKRGNPLEKRYKAAKDTAKFIWILKIRPAVDKFLGEK